MKRQNNKPTPTHAVSPLLRELLEASDRSELSRDRIAKKIGVSHPSIWRWARGKNSPSLMSVESMAQVLGYKLVLAPLDTSVKDM